jgi:hypothetical protein
VLFAAFVFIALVAATTYSLARPGAVAVGLTLAAALAWLPADSPVEGWVLVRLGEGHGITVADLLSVLAMVMALGAWAAGHAPAGLDVDRAEALRSSERR